MYGRGGEAETSVPLFYFRLRYWFVLRAAAADDPVGTSFEVSVNVVEKAHDVRIGPLCRHHEDILCAVSERLTIDDTPVDDDVGKLVVTECLLCVDQRRRKSAAGPVLPVAPITSALVVKIAGEGVRIDDPILDRVRLRAFGGIGAEEGHSRRGGE